MKINTLIVQHESLIVAKRITNAALKDHEKGVSLALAHLYAAYSTLREMGVTNKDINDFLDTFALMTGETHD